MDETIRFRYQGATFELSREELISSGWFVRTGESDPRILLIGSNGRDANGYSPIVRAYDFSRAPIAKRL